MNTNNIKTLLNQWRQQTNFKSLVHNEQSGQYKKYDIYTKITISVLGLFTTFDIIFSGQFKEHPSFNILNIIAIIAVIVITILTSFELHIKYPDQAEHHHILAILYSQIKDEIDSFLIQNGNTTREQALSFYNKIQKQIYLIDTMECECSQSIEENIEQQVKRNGLDINLNFLLQNKKKNKYSERQTTFIKNLDIEQLQNTIHAFCQQQQIEEENIYNQESKENLINNITTNLNIPCSFIENILTNNNDSVIEIQEINKNLINILCIDDDPIHNKILKNVMKLQKINIEYVLNVEEGYDLFLNKKYDLIIVDYKFPESSGIQFTEMVRNSESRNKNITIIGMSAYDDSNIRELCINSGMNDFISKPIIKSKIYQITKYI